MTDFGQLDPLPAICTGLRAPQVLRQIPGLSYRKLDYWSRTKRLTPHVHDHVETGSGIPYCWPLDQVETAARMFRLTQLGFNLDVATDLARSRERLQELLDALQVLAVGWPVRAVRRAG